MRVTRTLQILFRISRLPPAACIRSSPFSVCLSSLVRRKTRGNRLQYDTGERRTLRFSFGAVSTLRRPWNTSFSLDHSWIWHFSKIAFSFFSLLLMKFLRYFGFDFGKKRLLGENWRGLRANFVSWIEESCYSWKMKRKATCKLDFLILDCPFSRYHFRIYDLDLKTTLLIHFNRFTFTTEIKIKIKLILDSNWDWTTPMDNFLNQIKRLGFFSMVTMAISIQKVSRNF